MASILHVGIALETTSDRLYPYRNRMQDAEVLRLHAVADSVGVVLPNWLSGGYSLKHMNRTVILLKICVLWDMRPCRVNPR
jgi:hypothetical protein